MERPYERCLALGAAALSDAELLAAVIRSGTNGKSAVELSKEILALAGEKNGLLGLCHLRTEELMAIAGIGPAKAVQLQCVAELSKRIAARSAEERLSFTSPESVASYYMEQLRHKEQELLLAVLLDTKMHRIADEVLTVGTVRSSPVSPRELFLTALRYKAVSLILIHNHPSGDPTPSKEDIDITKKIAEAGRLLDIMLVDHIIIGDRRYYSFLEQEKLSIQG